MTKALAHFGTATLTLLAIMMFNGHSFASERTAQPDLKEVVKWGVWHEGCRIYSTNDTLGDADQLRECLVGVYANDAAAKQMVRSASKATLSAVIRSAGSEIAAERQLDRFVEFACTKKGLLRSFKQMADAGDFDGMRSLYYGTFEAHAEIRNLLAAVSNHELGDLIKEIELGEQVRQMSGGEQHQPMVGSD